MKEQEWLECTDPTPMLVSLGGKGSDRKLRLFACACCRRIWHLLIDNCTFRDFLILKCSKTSGKRGQLSNNGRFKSPLIPSGIRKMLEKPAKNRLLPCKKIAESAVDKRSREAVEVAERYADGRATDEELETASDAAHVVWAADMKRAAKEGKWDRRSLLPYYGASAAAYNVAIPLGWWGAAPAFVAPAEIARETVPDTGAEGAAQCVLLRDIVGNPFCPVVLEPAWLTWHDGLLVSMAQKMYDSRDFSDMPVLADALEEAGCDNADILTHCRHPTEHVRGCWVVDLILAKA